MVTRLVPLLAVVLVLGLARPAPAVPPVPTLVPEVTVDDDVIRLGDLFENVGPKAMVAVAYAPKLGRSVVLDAGWLAEIARAHRLRWRPRSRFDRVVVRRASQVLDKDTVEAQLRSAFVRRGIDGSFRIELDNRLFSLNLPPKAPPTIAVKDLQLDERTGRFSAKLLAPAGNPIIVRTVHGRLRTVVKVPVLARRLTKGQVISREDVTLIPVDARRVKSDTVTDVSQLIGMAPRRMLRNHVPVRLSDVRRPLLVSKGEMVTLMLRTPAMTLTARGKAAESGSKGDLIRVINVQSKRPVAGVVAGPGMVVVSVLGPRAAN